MFQNSLEGLWIPTEISSQYPLICWKMFQARTLSLFPRSLVEVLRPSETVLKYFLPLDYCVIALRLPFILYTYIANFLPFIFCSSCYLNACHVLFISYLSFVLARFVYARLSLPEPPYFSSRLPLLYFVPFCTPSSLHSLSCYQHHCPQVC